jgi:hypothetical protein
VESASGRGGINSKIQSIYILFGDLCTPFKVGTKRLLVAKRKIWRSRLECIGLAEDVGSLALHLHVVSHHRRMGSDNALACRSNRVSEELTRFVHHVIVDGEVSEAQHSTSKTAHTNFPNHNQACALARRPERSLDREAVNDFTSGRRPKGGSRLTTRTWKN